MFTHVVSRYKAPYSSLAGHHKEVRVGTTGEEHRNHTEKDSLCKYFSPETEARRESEGRSTYQNIQYSKYTDEKL